MASTTVYRKRNDTASALRAQCLDGTDLASASAVSLVGATSVSVLIRKPDGSTISGSATVDDQTVNPGWVSYTWGSTDLSVVGEYWVELEVLWATGGKQTFPSYRFAKVVVSADVNDS